MKDPAAPHNEQERLAALRRYGVLDTSPEPAFDDLTQLAARICGTPIALVSLVDEHRHWFKSRQGFDVSETPRRDFFCAHALAESGTLVVYDARLDDRFAGLPMVAGPPDLRFYAGAPLLTPQGLVMGTLAVLDVKPRKLGAGRVEALRTIARQVVTQLELRLHVGELEREIANHQRTEAALRTAEEKYRSIFENVVEGIFQTSPEGKYISANAMLARIYGYPSAAELMATFNDIATQLYVNPARREQFVQEINERGEVSRFESEIRRRDGVVIWISENARAVRDPLGRVIYYEGTVEDITDRKRAEDTLRYSEMRFRSVWESSADGMRLTDKDGVVLAVNNAFCRITGIPREDIIFKTFVSVYPESDDPPARLEKYRERFNTRSIESHMERRVSFRNGMTVDVEVSNSFIELEGREPLLLSVFHDITARKRAEGALRDSEILYHSLVETIPQNIFRKDLDERFTFVNQRFCQSLGRSREEILGKTDFDFFPAEMAVKYQRDDQRIMESGETYETVEAHQTPDHGKIYVQVVKTPLRDGTGRVVGIQGMFWDVTERKRMEEQLAFERDLLRALLDNVPDRIYFKDTESRFMRCNQAMADRLGLESPEQVVGKTDFDFHPRDRAQEFYDDEQRLILTGRPLISKTERQVALDGSEIWASVTKVPTRNKSGSITGLIGISRDITELKRTERALAEARDEALESARIKSEFLATVSHEIRTPMNAIIGMAGLILETALTDEQRDFAATIQESADALLTIINDILDFSKIEAGRITFETIDFDLRDMVESTVELLAHRAQAKGIELAYLIPFDLPVRLRGDPGRLRQVLLNLIGNAVKFTDKGEVVVRVEKREEGAAGIRLHFEVQDTGIGIPNEMQARVFEAFTQADGSTTRKYGGTGLGLSISRRLVELMGGQIGLRSSPNQGSTFWFEVYLEKQPAGAAETPAEPKGHLAGARVLIVDDNETNRRILRLQTTAWRMEGDCAIGGAEALNLLRRAAAAGQPFDIAILDMQMPEMDGLALAHAIKADPAISGTRLVMLTSMGLRLENDVMRAAGILECHLKPVRQSRLFDALTMALADAPSAAGAASNQPELPRAVPVPAAPGVRPNLRILLAEDNHVNQKVAMLQLRKLGFTADTVGNGSEVLESVRRIPYDVILMDCHMPILDGYETTRQLRQWEEQSRQGGAPRPPIYVVAMTANAMQGDRDRCIEAGMNDYVTKPVDVRDLLDALHRAAPGPTESPVPVANTPHSAQSETIEILDPSVIAGLRELRQTGESDPVAELIDLFLEDGPPRINKLEEACRNADGPAIQAVAHSLKGSAGNLGARRLAATCARMEQSAREGKVAEAIAVLPEVRSEFQTLSGVLEIEKTR